MRTLIKFPFFLLTLAALFWLAWQGYLLIESKGKELDPVIRSILVGTAIIVIFCSLILGASIRNGAREITMLDLKRQRVDQYDNFLTIWQALKNEVNEEHRTKLSLQADEFKASLTLVASPEVIKKLNRLLEKTSLEGPHQSQVEFESLLLSMRTDLGQSNLYPLPNEIKKLFSTLNK